MEVRVWGLTQESFGEKAMKVLDSWFSKRKVSFGLKLPPSPPPTPLWSLEKKLNSQTILCIPEAKDVYGDKEAGPILGNAQNFSALGGGEYMFLPPSR